MPSQIKEDLVIIICQPDHDIVDKVLILYMMLNKTFFHFIFIPGENYEMINFLSGPGVGNRYSVTGFNIDLVPIDNDLISMEKNGSFKEIYVNKDTTTISDFAESFVKLEICFGKVKHKYIKGEKAKLFNELLEKKELEVNMKTTDEILGMIVLDRSVDFITPFTSNYTYEGLFDEHFGINRGNCIFENKYLNVDKPKKDDDKKVLYHLTSDYASKLYNDIKCMNYLDASKYMYELKAYYVKESQKKNANSNDLSNLQSIMKTWNEFLTLYKNTLVQNGKFMDKFIEENLKPDNCIGFGSAFKVPTMFYVDMPNPRPLSNNVDLTDVWYNAPKSMETRFTDINSIMNQQVAITSNASKIPETPVTTIPTLTNTDTVVSSTTTTPVLNRFINADQDSEESNSTTIPSVDNFKNTSN